MITRKQLFLLSSFVLAISIVTLRPFRVSFVNAQFLSPIQSPATSSPATIFTKEEQIALQYFSDTFSVPKDQLHVGGAVVVKYPLTSKTVWQATVAAQDGKQSEIITIDTDTGIVVDGDKTQQAEEEESTKKYGKLDPSLYDHLQDVKDNELIPISIWFNISVEHVRTDILAKYPEAKLMGFQPSQETDLKLYDKIFAEIIVAETKAYQERMDPIVADFDQQGIRVRSVIQLAPIIHVECTKLQLSEIIERDDVGTVYLDKDLQLLLDSTASSDRVPAVWNRGITGGGSQVAIIEGEGIYFAHTYLMDGAYFNSGTPNIGTHATWMAGIIASTHPTYRGVAYGSPSLYSANAASNATADLEPATLAAVNANSNVLNFSVGINNGGTIEGFTKFVDHMAFNYLRTVVAGSGNLTYQNVYLPSLGYNVISVGGLSDYNTPNWSDDQIWAEPFQLFLGSTWKNPQDGREKPEVTADADEVTTTDTSNGFSVPCDIVCFAGTSGATAQVSGLAALLMQRNAVLKSWPQIVKSVIMASAYTGNHAPGMGDAGWEVAGVNVALPYVYKSYYGFTSDIRLFNSGSSSTNVTLNYYDSSGSSVINDITSLNAGGSTVKQPNTGSNFYGSVRVQSAQPIAVMVDHTNTNIDISTQGGVTGTVHYLPYIFKQYAGWDSCFVIRNLESSSTTLSITYYWGNTYYTENPQPTVSGYGMLTRCQASNPNIDNGPLAARIASTSNPQRNLVVAINQSNGGQGWHMSYNGTTAPSQLVVLPALLRNYDRSGIWNSGFQIQNASPTTANVNVKFYAGDGTYQSGDDINTTITPGVSKGYYMPSIAGLDTGVWSAVISANQRLAVVGNARCTSACTGDTVYAYNGINR